MFRRRAPGPRGGRRPFRRMIRRPPPPQRIRIPVAVRQALAKAHSAREAGDFEKAAQIFGHEAAAARERDQLVAATKLSLQASRAYLEADKIQEAVERGKQSLRLMARSGKVGRIPVVLNRMVQEMKERGYEAEAEELRREVEERLNEAGLSMAEIESNQAALRGERRGELPGKCDTCGGPLNPNEVEWYDNTTAECTYCGSVIKTS